jgi:Ca2+/Na+ antiporter
LTIIILSILFTSTLEMRMRKGRSKMARAARTGARLINLSAGKNVAGIISNAIESLSDEQKEVKAEKAHITRIVVMVFTIGLVIVAIVFIISDKRLQPPRDTHVVTKHLTKEAGRDLKFLL